MDNEALKSNQLETWTAVAPGWKKHDVRLASLTQPVTQRMIQNLAPGQRVLDIACGTGEPAIPAAERVGPSGRVLAVDFVEDMVATAREKAARRGLTNIEFRVVDGERLDVPGAAFDAVTMRWGLMFMPDPPACLTRALQALTKGAEIALTCWAGPEKNPWASIPIRVLQRHLEIPMPPPGAPGLFAFADAARLRATVEAAGFASVAVEELQLTMSDFDNGADYFDFTMELAGPIAMLFRQLPEDKQPAVRREIEQEAERSAGGRVHLMGVTWVATGRAS
jgi:SAM-dependent methyltransferase